MTVFVIVLVALFVATAAWLGYQFAHDQLHDDRQRAAQDRAALDAEWQALDRTRRLRGVFFTASRALRDEALRARQEQDGGQQ